MPSFAASARNARTRCNCEPRMSGPQSRSANAGPVLSAANFSPSRDSNSSYRDASTSTRLPAEHVWPAFCTIALTSAGNAASRSASAKTICGDLPPSSSVTGQWRLAAAAATQVPVAGEPVNET